MLDVQVTQVVPVFGFGLLSLLFWYVALHLKAPIEILGEEVYNNQNNHKPNNRNRWAEEALVDRANHVNGVRGNINSTIK